MPNDLTLGLRVIEEQCWVGRRQQRVYERLSAS
jgi:hypothetical protein